jgi:hypothetical protein
MDINNERTDSSMGGLDDAVAEAEARLLASDVGWATMVAVAEAVDGVCTASSTEPADVGLADGRAWFLKIARMLTRRPGIP